MAWLIVMMEQVVIFLTDYSRNTTASGGWKKMLDVRSVNLIFSQMQCRNLGRARLPELILMDLQELHSAMCSDIGLRESGG